MCSQVWESVIYILVSISLPPTPSPTQHKPVSIPICPLRPLFKGGYEFPPEKPTRFFSLSIWPDISREVCTTGKPLFLKQSSLCCHCTAFSWLFSSFSGWCIFASFVPLFLFFLFFASRVEMFPGAAIASQCVRCTSTHKVSTASLCWGPAHLSRRGLSSERLASVLHVQLPTRHPLLFVLQDFQI